jgi:hypothetical protein
MKPIALAILLSGCSIDLGPTVQYLAPELSLGTVGSYWREFCNYCPCEGKTQFAVLVAKLPTSAKETAVATCTTQPGGAIYILLSKWLEWSDMRRRVVFVHEMAHCELGKKHDINNWLMQGNGITDWELKDKTIEDVYEAACGFKK